MTSTPHPKILVLSGTAPGEPGVGGVILNDLQKNYAGELHFMPVMPKSSAPPQNDAMVCSFEQRYETGWRPFGGPVGKTAGWAVRKRLFERHCQQISDAICAEAAARDCDHVWAILDRPTIIQIAKDVAQRLNKPLFLLVWDAPELFRDTLQLNDRSMADMMKSFRATLQAAERVGVICESMEQAYRERYGLQETVVVRHGLGEEAWRGPLEPLDVETVRIGFAGSITAQQPFRALIKLLDDNDWRIAGRPVTLRMAGSRYLLDSRRPQHIEFFGWRSQDETIAMLADCHFSYLPQPFEPELRPLAELSFPTKLTTYLAAGQPVLLHAPEYGSVSQFWARYPTGVHCDTLDPAAMLRSIEEILTLPAETVGPVIAEARRAEFSETVFVRRFEELMALPAHSGA